MWITRDVLHLIWEMETSSSHIIVTLRLSMQVTHVILDLQAHLVGMGQQLDISSPHQTLPPASTLVKCMFSSMVKSARPSCRSLPHPGWMLAAYKRPTQVPACPVGSNVSSFSLLYNHLSFQTVCPANLSTARNME